METTYRQPQNQSVQILLLKDSPYVCSMVHESLLDSYTKDVGTIDIASWIS
jgi:hypothetical protein